MEESPMRKFWYSLFFAFFVLVLFLFKPRQDVVFAAINESQYIRLFENGKEFELCVEDNNSYRGTYTVSKDTVFLWYEEHAELSTIFLKVNQREDHTIIPVKLFINNSSSQIESIDNTQFSAQIYLHDTQKLNNPEPVNLRLLRSQTARISATRPRAVH